MEFKWITDWLTEITDSDLFMILVNEVIFYICCQKNNKA